MFGFEKFLHQLQQSKNDFKKIIVAVESDQGTVKLLMNGLQEVEEIHFGQNASGLLRQGKLEGLVCEAFNEALRQSRHLLKGEITRLAGGMNLPEIPGLF